MVWGGIIGDHLIGPYFFDGNVTGQSYLEMLQNNVIPALVERGYTISDVIFQHDGAPPHFTLDVREWLDNTFDEWIGRGGDILWPPRSPDYNPLDFFLWGYVKNKVYQTQPADMNDIRNRIALAFDSVTPEMLIALQHNFSRRMDLTIEQQGGHIEQLL